jgi:hypothetical protein
VIEWSCASLSTPGGSIPVKLSESKMCVFLSLLPPFFPPRTDPSRHSATSQGSIPSRRRPLHPLLDDHRSPSERLLDQDRYLHRRLPRLRTKPDQAARHDGRCEPGRRTGDGHAGGGVHVRDVSAAGAVEGLLGWSVQRDGGRREGEWTTSRERKKEEEEEKGPFSAFCTPTAHTTLSLTLITITFTVSSPSTASFSFSRGSSTAPLSSTTLPASCPPSFSARSR